jgi:hypothetical protein
MLRILLFTVQTSTKIRQLVYLIRVMKATVKTTKAYRMAKELRAGLPIHQKRWIWDTCLTFHTRRQLAFGALHISIGLSEDSNAPCKYLVAF